MGEIKHLFIFENNFSLTHQTSTDRAQVSRPTESTYSNTWPFAWHTVSWRLALNVSEKFNCHVTKHIQISLLGEKLIHFRLNPTLTEYYLNYWAFHTYSYTNTVESPYLTVFLSVSYRNRPNIVLKILSKSMKNDIWY